MKLHLNLNVHYGSTKRRPTGPRAVSFVPPLSNVAPSALVDEEAEAVKAKAREEKREETERLGMSAHD